MLCFEHYTQCFHYYTQLFHHYTRCFHHYMRCFHHYMRCFHLYTQCFEHYTPCFSVIIISERVPLVSVVECYTILLYVMSSRISKHSSNIHRAITCHFLLRNLQVERSYKTVKYIRLFWRFKSKVNPGVLKYGTNTAIFKFGDFAWPI